VKFIVDESTGTTVARYLRDAGHDVVIVVESMPQASDRDILLKAASENRIVITNNKDFGDLVFRSRERNFGVLLLRLKEDVAANRVRVVQMVLEDHAARLAGSFTVASEDNVRIRPILRLVSPKED
jgi:predicted nuclease of predicted toxin-antitoxin system